eukprot:GILJ01003603.1.p1 GENE.GILJ01003603.1~~GILJ01003603.1.p1  ORF type:complete len:791 (-),score=83.24 GILJ01003603.1:145-2424(-)
MRFKITQQNTNEHNDIVTAVAWTASNELLSCGDDNRILRWNMKGEPAGPVVEHVDSYCTDLAWYNGAKGTASVFAVACTDGTFRLISGTGRVEKTVEAHKGAVVSMRWNHEGSALASAGEDGQVKVWSRSGMLRSSIVTLPRAVYCVVWSPDADALLLASENNIILKSLQAGPKQMQWKAHEGTVLKIDWNPLNNLIVSGGEDCKYKVWDHYGRQLFCSSPMDHVITSVSWAPNGQYFAVGSYNMLRLCDKTGWTSCRDKPSSGSLMNIAWTADSTGVACAGGNGSVIFGHIVDRELSWRHINVRLDEKNKVHVQDVLSETMDSFDFRDRVIEMSLGFGFFLVVTSAQCYVYNIQNWNTPHIFDLKDSVSFITQSERHFALVDLQTGVMIYNYEGRQLSTIKFPGLRLEFLNKSSLSLSPDVVSILDRTQPKLVRSFDLVSGRAISEPLEHNMEIQEMALSQCGSAADRKVCIVDKNRDLYISTVHKHNLMKLCSMVDTCMWNDSTDMLTAVADRKLLTWYYPNVVYVDRDLLEATKGCKDALAVGKLSQLVSFSGSQVSVRRADGAVIAMSVSPYPAMLYQDAEKGAWEKTIRLCRFVQDRTLWACLAAMAIHGRELHTAEIALAAIDEVDKVQFINHIKSIPSEQGRNAELSLFCRRPDEAEQILLQAKLVYRAIKLNIRLYRWDRALDLAVLHKTHVDTVLAYRQRYLQQHNRQESNKRFLQYAQEVSINWETIKSKIENEKRKESELPGARPYEQ